MSPHSPHSVEHLTEAFVEFENASRELSGFYRDLERQVIALTSELSHSRLAEARQLAEKERLAGRLANLLDALPGGVVVLDQHGRVQEFNPAASDLLGALTAGEAWAEVVARAFAPRWDDGHDVSLADGRLVNIATQSLSGEPGQILLLKEVTETRRLQDQLAHHKRLSAKTETAAALAHQIRTPLAAALLNVGNLRLAFQVPAAQAPIERAVGSLRKLERLVDDMLLFARGGQLDVGALPADAFLAALENAAQDACGSADYRLEFSAAPDSATIYANQAALISAALNLIENSYQACQGRGVMQVSSCVKDGHLEVLFADDGPGISDAQAALIFEPFHSTRSNGTGLGLPVARAIARAHAGDLSLRESAPGACFELRVPLAAVPGKGVLQSTTTVSCLAGAVADSTAE